MRAIPGDFDHTAVAAIDGRLDAIVGDDSATILLAIESGSRAWGFPSPDSDYDCRFFFVRREGDYLTPWPRRDVIETPLDGDLDVNGWDLGKALKLLLKGNAVVIEWLMSPIVYRGDPAFRADMLALATDHADPHRIARHYLHLGERQRRTYFADGKAVKLKKIFYALRPAAALRWLRLHPEAAIAPMHFPTLMAECAPPPDLVALVDGLIARKAVTRELGEAPLPAEVEAFIDSEFTIAEAMPPQRTSLSPEAMAAAEALFRKWVRA
jgi:predicted nucleotidyltransferase